MFYICIATEGGRAGSSSHFIALLYMTEPSSINWYQKTHWWAGADVLKSCRPSSPPSPSQPKYLLYEIASLCSSHYFLTVVMQRGIIN